MKKIVYVLSYLQQFRSELLSGLSQRLAEKGISLIVMYGEVKTKKVIIEENGGEYIKYKYRSNIFFKLTRMIGLFNDLKKISPDAVVFLYSPSNLTMLRIVLYCRMNHIPYATWRCGYDRSDYSKISKAIRSSLIYSVIRHASCNITYGTWYKSILVKNGISPDKIVVAQNTINVESILDLNKNFKRNYLNTLTKVLFVGALIKRKYLPSSIDAIDYLIKEGYKVEFNIVGGGTIMEELKSLVRTKRLEEHIHILGPKYGSELSNIFQENDLFLAAGLGGLALNEAMAYGLPIISTPVDGTGYDLVDGNGYLMDKYGDTELQIKFLKKFISLSPDEKINMSERSKQIVSSIASLNNLIDKHSYACRMLVHEV